MVSVVKTGIALIATAVVLLGIAGYVTTQIDGFAVFLFMPGLLLLIVGVTAISGSSGRPKPATDRP